MMVVCLFMFQIIDIMKSSFLKTPTCFGCVPIGSQVGSFQVHHHVKTIKSLYRILSVFCTSDRSKSSLSSLFLGVIETY